MARPRATTEQREEVRSGIRNAAAAIYATQGVSAISARSVALKAGVSVGTIYSHFGDLPGLMQSLWIERIAAQNLNFTELVGEYENGLDRLKALMRAYLRFGYENADLYKGAFLSLKPGTLHKLGSGPLDTTEFPTLLTETLKQCQAEGQVIAGEPAVMAQIIWSGLHGCLALPDHLDHRAFKPADDIAEPMIEALIRSVRA